MIRKTLPFLLFTVGVFAQDYTDLTAQLELIRQVLPASTRAGIIFDAENTTIEEEITVAINRLGYRVIKTPISDIREITVACRNLVGVYEVDFIFVVGDRMVSTRSAIRYVVSQTSGKSIPVFSPGDRAFQAGALGQFAKKDGRWTLKVNARVREKYEITIPADNDRISVE